MAKKGVKGKAAKRKRKKAASEQIPEARVVPIKWTNLEEAPLVFSNTQLVQHTNHEFVISFGNVEQPPIMDETDLKQAAKIESVPAHPAVRIVMPPARFADFLQILQANWERFLLKLGVEEAKK